MDLSSTKGTVEITGTVKWFDQGKGYGFITPDNGLPDVLLHVSCLKAFGYLIVFEGARIRCDAINGEKGLQAFRILNMDDSNAIRHEPQTREKVQAESGWERATVKWFNRVRGFGFLTLGEGTPEIFVHMETVRGSGFAELRYDQVLLVRWGTGSKGRMAADLRPDDTR